MNAQIATILKDKLASIDNGLDAQSNPLPPGLKFIERLAGLVQIGEKAQPTQIEGAFAVSKFPISLDSDYEECINKGCYKDLVPNSKQKGILYFESLGALPLSQSHGSFKYAVKLRLVCWINNKLIQGSNCKSISHQLITKIRTTLENGAFNSGAFTRITVRATNILDNDIKLFANYTYPSESVKFLMHPYEAFGIDFTVEFSISNDCLDELVLSPEIC